MADMLTYKGLPLVRSKNVIYYGDSSEEYIIRLVLNNVKNSDEIDLSGPVTVSLIYSDAESHKDDLVVKEHKIDDFYDAMQTGYIWLDRELKK